MEYNARTQTITNNDRTIYTGTNKDDRQILNATISPGIVHSARLCKGVKDGFLERRVPYFQAFHGSIVELIDDGKIGLKLSLKLLEKEKKGELFIGGRNGLTPIMRVLSKLGTSLPEVNENELNCRVIVYNLDERVLGIEFLS